MSRFLSPRRGTSTLLALAATLCAAALPLAAGSPARADATTATDVVGGPRLASTGVVVSRPAGVPAPPAVGAKAWVVADGDTGEVLGARAAHLRLYPASTLKTLTALTLIDKLDRDRVVTATWDDANIEGSRVGIVPNGTYTIDQLWEAVFLRSGNDAINTLAEANGGLEPTLAQMRAEITDLQAKDTTVVNPTGLDEKGQLSSAYDLALFGRAALSSPQIMHYAGMIKSDFPGKVVPAGAKRPTFQIWTEQKFVLNYDGALGIKNGYTTKAQNTLITAARRNGRTVLVTLMYDGYNTWKDAAKLTDWAFANADKVQPVGQLVDPLSTQQPPLSDTAARAVPSQPVAAAPRQDSSAGSGWLAAGLVLAAGGGAVVARRRVVVRRRTGRSTLPRP